MEISKRAAFMQDKLNEFCSGGCGNGSLACQRVVIEGRHDGI